MVDPGHCSITVQEDQFVVLSYVSNKPQKVVAVEDLFYCQCSPPSQAIAKPLIPDEQNFTSGTNHSFKWIGPSREKIVDAASTILLPAQLKTFL
ncbi:hypothetical protein EW146_g4266 [Bondarzewia mesenterica]|uniref:Uncharacterized protein n=1 Tax=Bondarzewia mesenterica TaxID=1095465 RepID=A0A4S4LVM7_9AGAM|nr:hypothetical protein EW146_g4266 [Bondarzewia mesenterica]